jgi:putative spermidine/putrescine transport system ATP-binding protein
VRHGSIDGRARSGDNVADVRLSEVTRSFGGQLVLDIPTLEVGDGELVALLGPSGCGKTTALRCIAGSLAIDSGRILIGPYDVTHVPAHQRNVGMVFQQYALFPHMTAHENIAYGLRARGLAAADIRTRVDEALALVALEGLGNRLPRQLSGGQQQRVAMARAVVYRPDVLLLDEPFSSLDAKLRIAMRGEVARLQKTLRLTMIFVTHDQQEALAVADRVAVMHRGRIEQIGTPAAVCERPQTSFVADFLGATNLVEATVVSAESPSHAIVLLPGGSRIRISTDGPLTVGASVRVTIGAGAARTIVS